MGKELIFMGNEWLNGTSEDKGRLRVLGVEQFTKSSFWPRFSSALTCDLRNLR